MNNNISKEETIITKKLILLALEDEPDGLSTEEIIDKISFMLDLTTKVLEIFHER